MKFIIIFPLASSLPLLHLHVDLMIYSSVHDPSVLLFPFFYMLVTFIASCFTELKILFLVRLLSKVPCHQ